MIIDAMHTLTGTTTWAWIMYSNQHFTYLSSLSAVFASNCKVQDEYDSLENRSWSQGERANLVGLWLDAITFPNNTRDSA